MEGDGEMKEGALSKPMSFNISAKMMIAVILFVLIVVLFYMYIVAPKIDEIKSLNDQIAKAEERLNLLLLAQERLSSIEREINIYNERLTTLKQILPPQSDEFLFSEEFVIIANKCGGKITNLNFDKNTKGQNLMPTFNLTYEAPNFESVVAFNKLLKDNYPQIVTIMQLTISKLVDQAGGTKYIVNTKGTINLSQRK